MQHRLTGRRRILVGLAFAFVSATFYGGSSVIAKSGMNDQDIPPLVFTSFSFLMGVGIISLLFHRSFKFRSGIPLKYFAFIMAAGLTSGCAVSLFTVAVDLAPIAVVTPIIFLHPLVTLILAHAFLQQIETVTPRVVTGAFFAVSGAILVVFGSAQL